MAKRLVDKEIAKFDSLDRVRVVIEDPTLTATGNLPVAEYGVGVPHTFDSVSEVSVRSNIAKGQLNKIRAFPQILNEHAESSREIQGTVAVANVVGQVFKASQDNIAALGFTAESAAGVSVDNFESYANTAALQVEWVAGGTNLALLEETVVKSGTKSMSMSGDILNDSWVNTISAADYTNYTFSLDWQQDKEYNKLKYEFYIGDGVNTKHFALVVNNKDVWNHFDINIATMVEDAGIVDVTAITSFGFRVTDREAGKIAYVDNIVATPPPGQLEVKLWDMGATLPTSAVTAINTGTQYTQIGDAQAASYILDLKGGKKLYHLHQFHCGLDKSVPTTELLVPDNYYIIEFKYVDTNVDIYGPNTAYATDYYQSGYAFTAPDEATAITAIGLYSDLMFLIYSRQEVYVTEVEWEFDAAPGDDADLAVFLEDDGMIITDVIVPHEEKPPQIAEEDVSARPMKLTDGGKFEFYYNDDYTDSVSSVVIEVKFLYEKQAANG